LKEKKVDELEKYEEEYLSRLKNKKKTESAVQKKPAVKKTKKKVSKKSAGTKIVKTRKTPKKKNKTYDDDDTGIVLIDDDLEVDEQMELEERKAYLEEARSQESSD
tara:strand:- start:306 stop:623 length:318 start_codon:yes stop_codon:yes gene_type:complete